MKKTLVVFWMLISLFSVSAIDSTMVESTFAAQVTQELSEESIKNVYAKAKEEGAEIYFSFNKEALKTIDNVVVKYATKLESKKKDKSAQEWTITEPISAEDFKYKIAELSGGTDYVFKVGYSKTGRLDDALSNKDNFIWSEKGKFKTERAWGIFKLLVLIGSLGIFIFGMKLMSEGLQKAAGSKMKQILSSMTSNRVKGVFSGFLITGLVQSSSATTVMTVSFVNAGLLTLVESAGIMMGANVGTTITAWLIDIFGFKVSIASYSLIMIAIAAPMMFARREKIKAWGGVIIGFALLFYGLGELKNSVPSLGPDSALVQFFVEYKDIPLLGNLIFILLGTLVTVVVQSSSAAMALTMTLCSSGIIPFEVACAMILGENIGTTITAELASIIGNVHAKRSARIHSLFNIVGVGWMFFALPLFFIDFVRWVLMYFGSADPLLDPAAATTGMAIFHSMFNIINVLILIWFVPLLVKLAVRTVKSKGGVDEEFHLEYIATGMMSTAELSLIEAKKEILKFGKQTRKMNGFVKDLMVETEAKKATALLSRIKKYEDITDRLEVEISDYLRSVSQGSLTQEASTNIRGMLSTIGDLERIGDIYYQMSKVLERKMEEKTYFIPEQRNNILSLLDKLEEAFDIMVSNLEAEEGSVSIVAAKQKEGDINTLRNNLRKAHLANVEKGEYDVKSGMAYSDLYSSCEKVGDHIINVTEAIIGEV